ncbi:MAG TPA: hypothetical protein VHW23_33750 [Kofleriaceae bacterium]|nr:hypothetical protein [Kofleriaceae bacterium]
MLRWLRIVAVVFVALSMGASFSHVLELPAKLELDGEHYLAVQGIYRYFGAVSTVLELGSILLLLGVLVAGRHRVPALPTVMALTVFVAALLVWVVVVSPMNATFASWAAGAPVPWIEARQRWEWGHAAVFGLKLGAFVLLLEAAIL